jgi:translocator protein
MNSNPIIIRAIASLMFAGTLLVNALANILPINNLNTGQVSALYPSLFTPAGVTFSFWSVIYFLLFGFVIFSWIKKNDQLINAVLPWFILSCIFNITWILVWHFLYIGTSVCIMVFLLLTLIRIFHLIEEVREGTLYMLFVTVSFTIYLAWICVATIANISAFLVAVQWNAFAISEEIWTFFMMGIATLLGIVILFRNGKLEFALVIIWALAGIFLRWTNSEYDLIVYSSTIFCILLGLSVVVKAASRVSRKSF